MIYVTDTQEDAQQLADRVHAHLYATNEHYAASVTAGQTLRWAIPKERPDGSWFIQLRADALSALTVLERLRVVD